MDTLQLQLFASLAKTVNFSRTAEKFYITQPAVSHHIKALENSLGVKLLNRSSHEVSLTDEGAEFLPYVYQILEITSTAENRIQNMVQGRWGHIRIAALSSSSRLLRESLKQLNHQNPTIQVDIALLEGTSLLNSLQQGDYDFYFSVAEMFSAYNEYKYSVIHRDLYKLFVNKNIVDTIDLSDWSTIEHLPFASVLQSDTRLSNQIRLICKKRGFIPNIVSYYNRAESVLLSVDAGLGIAILPGELEKLYQCPNIVALPIEGDDNEFLSVFAWKTGKTSNACKLFKEIVLSLFPE